jgi:hypothetical protein
LRCWGVGWGIIDLEKNLNGVGFREVSGKILGWGDAGFVIFGVDWRGNSGKCCGVFGWGFGAWGEWGMNRFWDETMVL